MKTFKDRVNWSMVEEGPAICAFNAHAGHFEMKSEAQAIEVAAKAYRISEQPTVALMVEMIRALGKSERRKRLRERPYTDTSVKPKPSKLLLVVKKNTKTRKPEKTKIELFYDSWEWKRLSYAVKLERGCCCECCGAIAPDVRIITDHIKPIRHYWPLRLDRNNLQVLCDDCNRGKGSRDITDFRCNKTRVKSQDTNSVIWLSRTKRN